MFNDGWLKLDFINDDKESTFTNIFLKFKEIYLEMPEEIIVSDKYEYIKYDYDTFINTLFDSFSSYKEIEKQASVDLPRSNVILNGTCLYHKHVYELLVGVMDKNLLSQKEKYSILMLISQGVFSRPYYYVATKYKDYHLGELHINEKTNANRKILTKIILNKINKKIILKKILRLFTITENSTLTIKKLLFRIKINLDKKLISCKIKEIN